MQLQILTVVGIVFIFFNSGCMLWCWMTALTARICRLVKTPSLLPRAKLDAGCSMEWAEKVSAGTGIHIHI